MKFQGKYVGAKALNRLVWAWIEFIEDDDAALDELYLSLRGVAESHWPSDREMQEAKARRDQAREEER